MVFSPIRTRVEMRTAFTEARRFNDNTTKDIHVLATKEIHRSAP
jgi:hypothetical protein